MKRTYIRVTKGSGNDLLEVRIEGHLESSTTLFVNSIDANEKFLNDVERIDFSVGLSYKLSQIADFFLVERGFTTGLVHISQDAPVNLSTYLLPASMQVRGNGVVIADNDTSPSTSDHTDFGSVTASGANTVIRTFTVENIGQGTLNLSGNPIVAVSGTDAAMFTVRQPQSQVPPGGAVTFQVVFDPSSTGAKTASLSIANNDPGANKNPYTFSIAGTGA